MSLVSTAQLTQLRAVAYRGLDTPVTIQRRTAIETDADVAYTWATVTTTLGWLRMMNKPHVVAQFGYIAGATNIFRLHLRHDVDVQPEDRVVIGDTTYEIQDSNQEDTIQVFRTLVVRSIE